MLEIFFKTLGIAEELWHLCPKPVRFMTPKYIIDNDMRRCRQCGQVMAVDTGRPDRKFCCQECKNAWHNANRVVSIRHYHDRISRVLESNYMILKHLQVMGVTSMDLRTLKELRFNTDYCTSFTKLAHRHHYTCFEIHYDLTATRILNIENILDRTPGGK